MIKDENYFSDKFYDIFEVDTEFNNIELNNYFKFK